MYMTPKKKIEPQVNKLLAQKIYNGNRGKIKTIKIKLVPKRGRRSKIEKNSSCTHQVRR